MLFKGKQITCNINYESEKYTFELDRHKTLNDLYTMFQDKVKSQECYFIILFSPTGSNNKELVELKNLETTLISLEKDKNDVLNFQFLKTFQCPSCLLYCDNEKKFINKYCIECNMYICSDCAKDKKHEKHYLINIDQNNLKDSIKLWNINLNAELSAQITNFNKQIDFITDDLDIKVKIWLDSIYKKLKSFEIMMNNIKIKTQEMKYYFQETEDILNKAMANLTKSEQEININIFSNEKNYLNMNKYLTLQDAEVHLQKLKNNYTEIITAKKNIYDIINPESIKKWEEMIQNVPKAFDQMFKATDIIMEDLRIYEIKNKKNERKESNQGRRRKPELYLSGNLLFKTENEVQIGLVKKKNKNIYIMPDNDRKKTDLSMKFKKVNGLKENGEDGNNKISDYTNRGTQNIIDRKKSGEYKAFENEFMNSLKYINKDRNRYTPKNLKLPKIGMNEKDKYSADYFEKYRYKDDMKKSMDFNRNTIKIKKV